jgi:hypothetical protein
MRAVPWGGEQHYRLLPLAFSAGSVVAAYCLLLSSESHFILQAWPVVEAGTSYVQSWHVVAVCEQLEASLAARSAAC